jgi:hypothetical protein
MVVKRHGHTQHPADCRASGVWTPRPVAMGEQNLSAAACHTQHSKQPRWVGDRVRWWPERYSRQPERGVRTADCGGSSPLRHAALPPVRRFSPVPPRIPLARHEHLPDSSAVRDCSILFPIERFPHPKDPANQSMNDLILSM